MPNHWRSIAALRPGRRADRTSWPFRPPCRCCAGLGPLPRPAAMPGDIDAGIRTTGRWNLVTREFSTNFPGKPLQGRQTGEDCRHHLAKQDAGHSRRNGHQPVDLKHLYDNNPGTEADACTARTGGVQQRCMSALESTPACQGVDVRAARADSRSKGCGPPGFPDEPAGFLPDARCPPVQAASVSSRPFGRLTKVAGSSSVPPSAKRRLTEQQVREVGEARMSSASASRRAISRCSRFQLQRRLAAGTS